MKINKNIRKFFLLLSWLLIGGGVVVLLVAAVNVKRQQTCKGVEIDITGVEEFYFLDKQDVRDKIIQDNSERPEGQLVTGFNLQRLEETLENNVWVRDAELFFDNNMVLHVNISEREPIARIFTTTGKTYYIDSSVHNMPLSDKMNVRIPVFTAFPSDKVKLKGADLELMKQVRNLALYISGNEFFKAQIAQVDITPSRNFEMVPVIGNHVIEFGNGENLESKFRRLFIFYHQVLRETGFDRYNRINVQFERQIIGTRRAFAGNIDSVQAIENIAQLIEESKRIITDSVLTLVDKYPASLKKADSTLPVNAMPAKVTKDSVITRQRHTVPAKDSSEKELRKKKDPAKLPVRKSETNPSNVDEKPKPKAVMPKLT